MSLRANQLHSLAAYLSSYSGGRVSKFVQYGKDVFSFHLQRAGRLVVSLDNQNPCLFIGEEEPGKTSLSTPMSALLRKKLSGAEFLKAELLNEDRVIALRFRGLNDIFQEEDLTLVLELIPTKANMALLDENGKVLLAFRPNSITDPRPIFHGITYEPPLKKNSFPLEPIEFDVEAYFASCQQYEERIKTERKQNVYQDFFRAQNAKIKSLRHKIASIERDIEKGKEHLHDADYGNYIYTYGEDIRQGDKSFDYYGVQVALDPLKSPQDNATDFFKKAKKAKNAIALGEENKKKASEELEEALRLLDFASTVDEETLSHLFTPEKKGAPKVHKKHSFDVKGPLPYVIKSEGHVFYFGKNAKQNDYLTFLYATNPSFYWFHVKDQTGAHLILPEANPSEATLNLACALVLLASGKEEGEVQYTQHKNIRRGSVKGQVILASYRSATFRSIPEEARELYRSIEVKER